MFQLRRVVFVPSEQRRPRSSVHRERPRLALPGGQGDHRPHLTSGQHRQDQRRRQVPAEQTVRRNPLGSWRWTCVSLRTFVLRLTPREFNSYGARRGNDAVMTRGTFASIKLQNRFIGKPGPKTLHVPSGQTVSRNLRVRTCWSKERLS